jgi:hypothetical protein
MSLQVRLAPCSFVMCTSSSVGIVPPDFDLFDWSGQQGEEAVHFSVVDAKDCKQSAFEVGDKTVSAMEWISLFRLAAWCSMVL